ncbi:hypothetical protein [Caldibacillus thermoamylovorans]|uniref:hypothetical protein n=1 Tax=Caldibacillus thermoamylovorans TaxID=35841 RepID=UPI0022E5B8C1|nr:hypothetical protein [Caldibacillus thermoamylovorans]
MATRTWLVVKIGLFPTKNGDENEARRQKYDFLAQKQRRDSLLSPKNTTFR